MIFKILISSILLLSGATSPVYASATSDLAEEWGYTSMTWTRGRRGLRDVGQDKSHAILLSVKARDSIWVEAVVSVDSAIGTGWKIAGVTLYRDIKNYWHLALVEAPGVGGGRFFELKRMRNGIWGDDTGVVWGERKAYVNIWHNRQGYRLRLEKRGSRITGKIWDRHGKLVYKAMVDEVKYSDTEIYPGLDNEGFSTDFSRFHYYLFQVSEERKPDIYEMGFFRVMKDEETYWLVNPEGRRTLSIGCELVKYHNVWCQSLGYAPYHRNVEKLFGSESAWARDVADKLHFWSFNSVGQSEMPEEIVRQKLSYTPILRLGQGFSDIAWIVPKTFWTGFPDVFHPKFDLYCRMIAEEKCRLWRDDSNLLGYYIDNELEWFGKDGRPWSLFTSAMRLGPQSPAKVAAIELLRRRHQRIDVFNSVWGADIKSWEALAETSLVLTPNNTSAMSDAESYISLCADEYFRITSAAIRRADPNHLVLGARFPWLAPKPAWEAAGKYCDIVSFNCYPRVDMLSGDIPGLRDSLENRYKLCAKPLFISEWGFPALDAGLPSTRGAGTRVDNQEQRAYCAARLQEELFSLPFVVGTSWFMWADEPALGVTDSFPENSNYGLVDVSHRPYLKLTAALASVNKKANEIHQNHAKVGIADSLRLRLFTTYGVACMKPRPALNMKDGRLYIDNVEVRLVLRPDKNPGVDSIYWRGIPMGSYHPLIWQRRIKDSWLAPDRVIGFTIDSIAGNGLALSYEAEKIPDDTTRCGFSISFRIIIPPAGSFFLVEVKNIASLDTKPWDMIGYYHYIPSWLGGETAGDKPLVPEVPKYWLKRGGWFDREAGLHFGALSLDETSWEFHPYIDKIGLQHPDIFKKKVLAMSSHKNIIVDDGPVIIYMGREDNRKPPWAMAAFQAWHWLGIARRERP